MAAAVIVHAAAHALSAAADRRQFGQAHQQAVKSDQGKTGSQQ